MKQQLSQKDGVYAAICAVTGFTEGTLSITKEQRAHVAVILFEGFKDGNIKLERSFSDQELKEYIPGLVSNWIRKDPRFNDGAKYVTKNPGSRAGSGDEQLKELKKLYSTMTTDEERAEIQSYIDARQAELNAQKQATIVNFDKLPADLAAKFRK